MEIEPSEEALKEAKANPEVQDDNQEQIKYLSEEIKYPDLLKVSFWSYNLLFVLSYSKSSHINKQLHNNNLVKYNINVDIIEVFKKQNLDTPHTEALSFIYYDDFKSESTSEPIKKYDSFDPAFIFNVSVFAFNSSNKGPSLIIINFDLGLF